MDAINLICNVLYLAKSQIPSHKKGESRFYIKESEYIRGAVVKTLPSIKKIKGNINDHEEWITWEYSMKLEGYGLVNCLLEHYKSRLILKFEIDIDKSDFKQLFKEARKFRSKIENTLKTNLNLDQLLKKYLESINAKKTKIEFYGYPLIVIDRLYQPVFLSEIKSEIKTTFFYEVTDPYPHKILRGRRDILIRMGRPSIIVTRLSQESFNNLIQAIYHTCLMKMRELGKKTINEYIYEEMRKFILDIFYKKQSEIAQIDEKRLVYYLTIIAGIASLAAIMSIIYVIPFEIGLSPDGWSEAKSFFGLGLLTLVGLFIISFILVGLIRYRYK